MNAQVDTHVTRKLIYIAIIVLLGAIYVGAVKGVSPIYLAVGFISEIILVCTVHLSSVIQKIAADHPGTPRA